MSRKVSRGYTLIEVIVVVAILAILASIGYPEYMRSVETSRALDGMNMTRLVALANKSYHLDRGIFADGELTDACNTACCAGAPGCGAAAADACNLVACGYLPKQSFVGSHYVYFAVPRIQVIPRCADAAPGLDTIACGRRKRCGIDIGDPLCIDESAWPFRCWGYLVDVNNVMHPNPNPKSPPPVPQ